MAIKTYKPTSAARRHMTVAKSELSKVKPEKSLLAKNTKHTGRNSYGRITVRHQGGGNKQKYRIIDMKRRTEGNAQVLTLEYDPNRTANIALIRYEDGKKAYILAPVGLKVGDTVESGPKSDIKPGNSLPISEIPVGTFIHNIELYPGAGAQLVRAAGAAAQLMAKEGNLAQVRLPSGETRIIRMDCKATIGQVGNLDYMNASMGKAGMKRHLGFRPHVRGVVQNPIDHPMGGGEGRSSGGGHPVSPWGQLAKGKRTRHPKKPSTKFIVERRKK